MHYFLRIYFFESGNKLLKHDPCLNLAKLPSYLLQLLKITSVAQLHDKVEVVLCALDVNELDHVRAFNFRQNVDFILQIVKKPLVQLSLLDDLDSMDLCWITFVMASEHGSKLAFAYGFLLYQVVSDSFHIFK